MEPVLFYPVFPLEVQVVAEWFKTAFLGHYPMLYQHRDTAEAARCLDLLPSLAPLNTDQGQLVLDLGCGDGRHLELLGKIGHAAVGLDLSMELLHGAQTRLGKETTSPLVRGDMRRVPFGEASFSTVLSLFTAFGYFGPPAANQDPVREVARVLVPGGHWFLDYFDCDRVRTELGGGEAHVRERELGPLKVREERRFVAEESLVAKRVRLEPRPGHESEATKLGVPADGLEYTEKVAVFTLRELDDMAAKENLTRVAAAGGYDGGSLGDGNRWILVYRKSTRDGPV
jgi:SAM-dependent methyltransferase